MRTFIFALLLLPLIGSAQPFNYPNRPLEMVVPFERDGGGDVVARLVQSRLAEVLGQPITVDNRPADGGYAAMEFAAKAAPDGHVLLLGTPHTMIAHPAYRGLPLSARNFIPVTPIGRIRGALLIQRTLPANDFAEFVAYAKANPGKLRYGVGEGVNLGWLSALEMMQREALELKCVQYAGSFDVVDAFAAGQIELMFGFGAVRSKAMKTGKAREVRNPAPEITLWIGVFVPQQTPDDTVSRVHQAVLKTLRDRGIMEKLRSMYLEVETDSSRQALQSFVAQETERWTNVIRKAGLKE